MSYSGKDYSNKLIDGKPAIWLQYYGYATAKPASEFQVGEFMRWNGGVDSKVVSIVRKTAKTIVFLLEEKPYRDGLPLQGERTLKADRPVAIGTGEGF